MKKGGSKGSLMTKSASPLRKSRPYIHTLPLRLGGPSLSRALREPCSPAQTRSAISDLLIHNPGHRQGDRARARLVGPSGRHPLPNHPHDDDDDAINTQEVRWTTATPVSQPLLPLWSRNKTSQLHGSIFPQGAGAPSNTSTHLLQAGRGVDSQLGSRVICAPGVSGRLCFVPPRACHLNLS